MIREYQHPGYPVLILAASKITGLFYNGGQLFCYIYSAQGIALLFRMFAIIVLYFFAKKAVGDRFAFWAIMILILLPKPAEYGSDALSDWPALFFLAAGMLLLLDGAKYNKWWSFGLAGIAAGLGYLIRPEGTQVVIYGALWVGLQLFWKKRAMTKSSAALALAAMLIAFIITAGPYMKLKGAIFPKKGVGEFSSLIQINAGDEPQRYDYDNFIASIVPSGIIYAAGTIFENTGDTLVWFFLLPYLIGFFLHFKKHKPLENEQFFIIALVIINVPLMIWLYCSYGYMSVRHTLPLVMFTIFYIPAGLQALASRLNVRFSKGFEHTHRWFAILMIIGTVVCIPRLLNPLHPDKMAFRQAAQWLARYTPESAIIGVPDYRISFYAERKGIRMEGSDIPEAAQYIVEINDGNSYAFDTEKMQKLEKVFSIQSSDSKKEIEIFKRRDLMQ